MAEDKKWVVAMIGCPALAEVSNKKMTSHEAHTLIEYGQIDFDFEEIGFDHTYSLNYIQEVCWGFDKKSEAVRFADKANKDGCGLLAVRLKWHQTESNNEQSN